MWHSRISDHEAALYYATELGGGCGRRRWCLQVWASDHVLGEMLPRRRRETGWDAPQRFADAIFGAQFHHRFGDIDSEEFALSICRLSGKAQMFLTRPPVPRPAFAAIRESGARKAVNRLDIIATGVLDDKHGGGRVRGDVD